MRDQNPPTEAGKITEAFHSYLADCTKNGDTCVWNGLFPLFWICWDVPKYSFYQDSHVFGIITCIADSMSESGLFFIHPDRDASEQVNNMVSEYEMDTLVLELTVANMVFGNSFLKNPMILIYFREKK